MMPEELQRFAQLCHEEADSQADRQGIGTYMEKRLHRILKRYYAETEEQTEVSVGSYVADIMIGDQIIEIQTGSFRPLYPKLRYYLEETDFRVTVVHPILAEHLLIRMDRETGEVLRKRRSNRPGRLTDLLPELYWIRSLLPNDRLTVRILLLSAEEIRYSERIRYRRQGAYEAELYPRELLGEQSFVTSLDYSPLLPESESFTAVEFEKRMRLNPRSANRALHALCEMGLLERELVDRKYVYRRQ